MGDLLKTVTKLGVSGDGRSAENWNSYRVQLENALSGKDIGGIYLDDVLLGGGPGVEVPDPGHDAAAWVPSTPAGTVRTPAAFAEAVAARSLWSRANRVTHGCVMGTLPEELQEECAQRLSVVELWRYLEERSAVASPFREIAQREGLSRTSLRNLAEYLLRLWAPVKVKPRGEDEAPWRPYA